MKNEKQPENSIETMSETLALDIANKLERGSINVEEMIAIIQLFVYQARSKGDS